MAMMPPSAGWRVSDWVEQRSGRMKQPHTEQTVRHTEDEQNTGTHKKPGAPDEKGADRFGGTRTGQENIEPSREKAPR
jgi:hypothetical protein